ncbi:MAG: hypothetical protein ABTQ34_03230 [Bdellovibrionales bacterium]
MRANALAVSNRNLRLGKDTVERQEETNGSTYTVTEAWWDAVVKDCAAYGEKLELASFSGK